jgi:hypothetical protein
MAEATGRDSMSDYKPPPSGRPAGGAVQAAAVPQGGRGRQLSKSDRDNVDAFMAVLRKVDRENPKPEDVTELRRLLRSDDRNWRLVGELMLQAQRMALKSMNLGKSKTLVHECVEEGMWRIRDELGYEASPTLEKLLIEQVVTTWLRMGITEANYSHIMDGTTSLAKAAYWDRALESAQRRYLRAIEALARVRRLKLPAMQLNVAQAGAHQMNVSARGFMQEADKPSTKGEHDDDH